MTATEKLRDAGERLFAQIVKWHEEDRQITIRRTFELGDMIVDYSIATGLSEYEVINRVRGMMGDLAMGVTSYNRAARMARVFTRNQRGVLIGAAVSLERAEILAGAKYEGRKRINVIHAIKTGRIKSPWSEICGARESEKKRLDHGVERRKCAPDVEIISVDLALSLRDSTETVADKLRGFLSKRSDAQEILSDVQAGIKRGVQVQHPESWGRQAI